jgi:hypothetical protein
MLLSRFKDAIVVVDMRKSVVESGVIFGELEALYR